MKYTSTRNSQLKVSASEAIVMGLSRDGGLFLPESIPQLPEAQLRELCGKSYVDRAAEVMKLYLDEFSLEELREFCTNAYSDKKFDVPEAAPLKTLDDDTAFLELWHGPTCAFKDMALQMLPYLLTASLKKTGETKTVCILVATSGDTGKAALEGFCDVDKTKILVFYPKNGVSDIQELQMVTQSGDNVGVCAVYGNFDDAQTGVKRIFSDESIRQTLEASGYFLSSANSINWGRVLPQIVYYISAYCDAVNHGMIEFGQKLNFCVPTGNFGNILAGYFAKLMGLPVGRFICASNSNNVLTDFINTGVYNKNRQFYTTTSPSMDILVSSNLERLLYLLTQDSGAVSEYMAQLSAEGTYTVSDAVKQAVQADFSAGFCSDEDVAKTIADTKGENGYLIDTHTAVAYTVLKNYRANTGDKSPCVVVSTASPFKFCESVLKALGETEMKPGCEVIQQLSDNTGVAVPRPLLTLKDKQVRFTQVVEKQGMDEAVLKMILG